METTTTSENSSLSLKRPDGPERIAVPVIFAIIFVIGVVGNATLIFIVIRNKTMRTKPGVLIVNMAIGDLILILISVPMAASFYMFEQWNFGNAMCKIYEFLQTLSLGVSVFTLAALAVDRFIAIVYPLNSYSSRSLTRVLSASALIWVISIGLALMDLVGAHVKVVCNTCITKMLICDLYPIEWGETYTYFRVIFRFIVFFALPLIIILVLYVSIAVVLLRQSETLANVMGLAIKDGNSRAPTVRRSSESSAVIRQIESRKKIAKVVLSFVVIFVICWFPRHVYVLCYRFHDFIFDMSWHVFKIIGFCLTFIYSAINPLALYFLNEEYRRYFHHYLFGCCYPPWRLQSGGTRRGTQNESMALQTMVTSASVEDLIDSSQKRSPEIVQLTKVKNVNTS